MAHPNSSNIYKPISFISALTAVVTVKRALKISAIVGTILITINHGDNIHEGNIPALWKIIFTYIVPYSVSSYSTATLMLEFMNNQKNIKFEDL